jgi:hypothetical protein
MKIEAIGWYINTGRPPVGLKELITGASANTVYLIRNYVSPNQIYRR